MTDLHFILFSPIGYFPHHNPQHTSVFKISGFEFRVSPLRCVRVRGVLGGGQDRAFACEQSIGSLKMTDLHFIRFSPIGYLSQS